MPGKKIKRREFIAYLAGAAAAGRAITGDIGPRPVLAVSAAAANPVASLRDALAALGGIGRFIRGGEWVMLLPNPQGRLAGASTRPELVAEMVRLCLAAGAGRVEICSIHDQGRWYGTGIDRAAQAAGAGLWTPSGGGAWREIDIPGARRQKRLLVISPVLEADLVINMPIAKQHGSTRFTGALKNLMGVNADNTSWHQGSAYLVDSIVDLASAVRPRLLVVDATEVLAENGPFGPGRTVKPGRVVVGVDPVAVDSVCCRLLEMRPAEVSTIVQAHQRGLGEMNLTEEVPASGGLILIRSGG